MKKTALLLAAFTFLIAVTATFFAACDDKFTDGDGYACIYPAENKGKNMIYEQFDSELPPESFVGTVIEETTAYMIVEPNKDENEYESFGDRVTVEYLHDHIDYLYGIGRKVVITYIPAIYSDAKPVIKTDDIRHDGFEEFELSVQYKDDSIPSRFLDNQPQGLLTLVANNKSFDEDASDYNLYYYGLHDVYVTVDGDTLPLIEALTFGKVTIDGIISRCLGGVSYDDGGSVIYDFGDYKIIKYHTLDGNRDVYIGTKDMDINAKNSRALCIGANLWKDWGIRLDTKDATFEGATVVFNRHGGDETGELQTGDAFWIERLAGNKWIAVDTLPLIDYAFHQVAYMINKNGETELETNWHWLYGALDSGKYRIAKEVTDFRDTGDYDEQFYYAYFEIQ